MENRRLKNLIVAISLAGMAVIVAGCSSETEVYSPSPPSDASSIINGQVQTSSGGNVTVDVQLVEAESDTLVFDVKMNTHSVNLDQYDLGKLAVLRDSGGNEYSAYSWKSEAGSHHRSGELTFSFADALKIVKSGSVELVIRDVAVKERVLKWQL